MYKIIYSLPASIVSVTNVDAALTQIAVASHVLSRTLRRSAEIQVGLQPLPPSEFDVVEYVGAHPGASVSDVARGLRLQTSNVSNVVRNLVNRGLLRRGTDSLDQRRVLLELTPKSSRHRELVQTAWASVLAGLLPALPEGDAELVVAAGPALVRLAELAAAGVVTAQPAEQPGLVTAQSAEQPGLGAAQVDPGIGRAGSTSAQAGGPASALLAG